MSCFGQYAPYSQLRPGLNWDDQKEAFGENVITTIAAYAPNIKTSSCTGRYSTRHPLDLNGRVGKWRKWHIFSRRALPSLEALLSVPAAGPPAGRNSDSYPKTFTCVDRPPILAAALIAGRDRLAAWKF